MEAPAWLRRFNWHLRGNRPPWLHQFSSRAVEFCLRHESEAVVVTGIAGLSGDALKQLSKAGVRVSELSYG